MENKGCITCRKCEQVRSNFFCGRKKLSQKQLYNKYGFCTRYEPVEQAKDISTLCVANSLNSPKKLTSNV